VKTELVNDSEVITPAVIVEQPTLPVLVERAGPAARIHAAQPIKAVVALKVKCGYWDH
jgi:hypothetical protein